MTADDDIAELAATSELLWQVRAAETQGARWAAIKRLYVEAWPKIKSLPRCRWAFDPNEAGWIEHMTPIELAIWSVIREAGAVLYPQHPVGDYFVDFGHPVARIAVECDGRAFHADKAKDAARQRAIEAKGWRVYRLTGGQCMRLQQEDCGDESGEAIDTSPAVELIDRLCREYALSARFGAAS